MFIGVFSIVQMSVASPQVSQKYDWVFIYYMSYDNDLDYCGEIILKELGHGVINSNIAVVVQADFNDSHGMRRISLRHVNDELHEEEHVLESEDSADEEEYRKYLQWVQNNWIAENYAIIFLDHGGALNDMCFDEKPFKDEEQNRKFAPSGKWLNAMKIGEICRKFNQDIGQKVKLLFLQQCGRGSLQNLYNFVNSATYIMASPLTVGAPNTYYTPMLQQVIKNPNITGIELAQLIMEEDQHYTMYTLINNTELQQLPDKLQQVFNVLPNTQVPKIRESLTTVFRFNDETNYDLQTFLVGIKTSQSDILAQAIDKFSEWYEQKLIVAKHTKEGRNVQLSGLSLYIPLSRKQLQRYSFLPLHQQTDIEKIFDVLLRE